MISPVMSLLYNLANSDGDIKNVRKFLFTLEKTTWLGLGEI